MMLRRYRPPIALLRALAMAALLWMQGHTAQAAQAYPNHPIRMIVPYVPGGSTDAVARIVALELGRELGQSIVVENRGGAGGKIGIDYVAKSAPDGYTLLFTDSGSMIVNAWLFDRTGSNPIKDFASIGRITVMENVLVAHPAAGLKNLADVVRKAQAGPMNYGSSGVGTLGHLAMVLLGRSLNIELTHVPYKGGAPVTNALLGGQIPMAALTVPTAAPYIQGGQFIAVAALSDHRTPILPGVPTVAEQGYPGVSAALWQGLYAPAGTPADIVARLNTQLRAIAATPEVRRRLEAAGNQVAGDLDLEQTAGLVKQDYEKWGGIIKEMGITVQ